MAGLGLDCSKVTIGYAQTECGSVPVAGTTGYSVMMSYSDIDRTKSTIVDGVLTSIVLKTGAKGYEVVTLSNSGIEGSVAASVGTHLTTFLHTTVVRMFQKSEAGKKFVNQFGTARVVLLVQNNDVGPLGEVTYEVYGWDSGLTLSEVVASTVMADDIAYTVTVASQGAAKEGSIAKSFFVTDVDTTTTAVAKLLVPAVPVVAKAAPRV